MGVREGARAVTTEPGYKNPNRQIVVNKNGAPSTTRDNQIVYRLRCELCQHEYGCNGMDIKARLCPKCQGGTAGEPLRDDASQASLF